jgi:hypothetical protein
MRFSPEITAFMMFHTITNSQQFYNLRIEIKIHLDAQCLCTVKIILSRVGVCPEDDAVNIKCLLI